MIFNITIWYRICLKSCQSTLNLVNWEILEVSQICVETEPGTHSPFHERNFGNNSQKLRKSRYQCCSSPVQLNWASLHCCKWFVQDCLSKQIFSHKWAYCHPLHWQQSKNTKRKLPRQSWSESFGTLPWFNLFSIRHN